MNESQPFRRLTLAQRTRLTAEKQLKEEISTDALNDLQQLGFVSAQGSHENIVDFYELLRSFTRLLNSIDKFRNFDDETRQLVPDVNRSYHILRGIFNITDYALQGLPFDQLPKNDREFVMKYAKTIPEQKWNSTAAWEEATEELLDTIFDKLSVDLTNALKDPKVKQKLKEYTNAIAADTDGIRNILERIRANALSPSRLSEDIATMGLDSVELQAEAIRRQTAQLKHELVEARPTDEELAEAQAVMDGIYQRLAKSSAATKNKLISSAPYILEVADNSLRGQYLHGIAKVLRLMHAQSQEHGRSGAAR
jgi:hypothetical protein